MARPDVFDSLNALTGMQGDQAQSDFEQAPLPYETPAMNQGRVAQGQQQRVQYGRMKAEDLASRGIPYDTSGRGNVSEITDATGAPLSNADKTNKIAYDSAGKPVDYSQRDPTTGKHVLTDPYANVPDWTEPTTGNVYRRPKGLPWVQTGTDPAVTQQIQAKVNAQTATALAPVEQQAKTALTQAAKAVKISGAQTKVALQTQGVILDPNAPDAAKKLDDAFNTEYGSPEANATPFWGGGTRTPEAEALRKQIDARKAAANAALAQHQQVVTNAQQAQAQLDQVRGTREQLQGDKMAELNRRRVAVGLDPINIGGNQTGPSVADVQQQGATLDTPGAPTPVPSPSAPEASPSPTVAAASPATAPAPQASNAAPTTPEELASAMEKPLPPGSEDSLPVTGDGRQHPLGSLIDRPVGSGATEADYPLESLAPLTREKVAAARANDYKNPSFGETAMTPTVPIMGQMGPQQAGKIARSIDPTGILDSMDIHGVDRTAALLHNVTADTLNFFTSPVGVATLGIGALPKLAQKAIAAVFAGQAAHEIPNSVRDVILAKTPEERDEAIKQTVESAAVLGGTSAHILDRARAANASVGDPNAGPVQRTFNEPPEEPQGPAGHGPSPNEPTPPSQPSPNAPNLALPQPPVSEPVSPAANEPATGNELALRQSELASMAPNDPMRPLVELQVKQLTNRETAPDSTETAALAQEPSAESQLQTEQRPSVIADESQVPAPVPEGTQPPSATEGSEGPVGEASAPIEQPPEPLSIQDQKAAGSSNEITPETEPAQEPTPKAKKPVASPSKSAEVLPLAAKSLPDVATLKPHEVLNDAKNVKLTTPKGARFLRVTDSKGRQIVEPLENVTKGANVFHQAGPFKRVEAGVLNSAKKFVPVPGELTATDANKPAPEPTAKQEQALVTPTKSPEAASVEKLANAALALHKDSLTTLDHPHSFETGETRAGSGIETDVQSQRIRIDPEKLAKATAKMTPAVRAEFVKRAVAQEVIHVGTLKYAAESAANRQKLLGLNDDEELMKRAADAYGPEWKDQSDFAKAAEAARMLLEGPEKLTEASYKFLKEFLEWMKGKLKNLSKDAREVLDGIRAKLGQYEKSASETKEQAPPKETETPATPENLRKAISEAKASGDDAMASGLEKVLARKEAKTFKRKIPEAPGGTDAIERLVSDIGKIKHPETARREQLRKEGKTMFQKTTNLGGEWDGWNNLPPMLRKLVFSKSSGINPDGAARDAYREGIIKSESPDALLDALKGAWQTRLNARTGEKMQAKEVRTAEKQGEQFTKDIANPKSGAAVNTGDLAKGDTVDVNGQALKVIDVDEDGNVTLEDHSRYGIQTVEDGNVIYGEVTKGDQAGGDFLGAENGIDPITDDAKIDTEEKAKAYADQHQLIESEATEPAAQSSPEQTPARKADDQREDRSREAESGGKEVGPKLRAGKSADDLLQGENDVFNLVSETSKDKAARELREIADENVKAERASAEARAEQEKQQKSLFGATPEDGTPAPGEGATPSSQQPSESQPDRPSTEEGALATGEDSVAARNEKLMEEAEAAGLSPSLETIKGVLRNDKGAMGKLRAMIKDRTGKDAINAATPENGLKPSTLALWKKLIRPNDRGIANNSEAMKIPDDHEIHTEPNGPLDVQTEAHPRPKEVVLSKDNGVTHFAEEKGQKGYKTHRFVTTDGNSELRVLEHFPYDDKKMAYDYGKPSASNIEFGFTKPDARRKGGMQKLILAADDAMPTPLKPDYMNTPEMMGVMRKMMANSEPEGESLGASNPLKSMRDTYDSVADALTARATKKEIAYKQDAVGNLANYHGQQAGDSIRLDLPDKMDREAMPFVIEAGGDKKKMTAMVQKIAASKDPKMAAKFDPIVDHAINNFDRLDKARSNHDKMMAESVKELKANGIDIGEVENYVSRKLDAPEEKEDMLPNPLFGGSGGGSGNPKYFTKGRVFDTLADAIGAGYRPKSTDLADLDAHRIEAAKKIIGQKQLFDELKQTKSPTDGEPIIGQMEQVKKLNGKTEAQVPRGYTVVQAGGQPLVIHNDFASIFKNLFGSSAIRTNAAGRALIKAAAVVKHGTLAVDTFHIGRMLFKMATAGGGGPLTVRNGHPAWNIHKGRALLEYTDADLGRAQAMGDITKKEADYARANRPKVEKLMEKGMNVGKVADNLMEQAKLHLPIVSKLNSWIFGKLSRSAMLQASIVNLDRNLKNSYYTEDQAYRQTAKEMNELFGNLQNQGILQNKTLQDISRLIFLAPNWTESQFRNEARAYAQTAKAPINAARGRGFRIGNSARVFAAGLVALLAANQVINYLSRGQSTFENKEKDHKLDSWIPGGKRGFWFSPLEIAGEYAHAAMKYLAQRENPVDVATHIMNNKLSPMARGTKEALTGRDAQGKHFLNNTDRFRGAATDALPVPMFTQPFMERDPRSPTGFREARTPASGEKQFLQSVGMKVTAAQSPRSQMFAIAQPFRADRQTNDAAGEYTELRRALDNGDDKSAKSEIRWLYDRGKTFDQIRSAVGISKSGEIKPENFAGNQDRESEMISKLKPDDRAIYAAAQREHVENASRLMRIIGSVPSPSSNAAAKLPRGVTPYSFK